MTDQADKLRALVHTASPAGDEADGALPMVVVTGGRAGVGATTVAVNLAAVLADRGERVLLVDGAQQRGGPIRPTGTPRDVEHSLADVLSGKCAIEDAILPGPAGIQMVLARSRDSQFDSAHCGTRLDVASSSRRILDRKDAATWGRLLAELQSLDGDFDSIVVDSGAGPTEWSRGFWARAKLIVLVTTPDDAAVLDAYTTLKQCAANALPLPIRLLVNQADCDIAANCAQRRFENACQRFLLRSIPALPALPRHLAGEFFVAHAAPRVWEMPNTPFGHAMLWLGRAVSELVGCQMSGVGCQENECRQLTV